MVTRGTSAVQIPTQTPPGATKSLLGLGFNHQESALPGTFRYARTNGTDGTFAQISRPQDLLSLCRTCKQLKQTGLPIFYEDVCLMIAEEDKWWTGLDDILDRGQLFLKWTKRLSILNKWSGVRR